MGRAIGAIEVASRFDAGPVSTIRRRIRPDRISFSFGPRTTSQEAIVTRTQMTRPPKSGFAETGERTIPFVLRLPGRNVDASNRKGWIDRSDRPPARRRKTKRRRPR
jgi:hypothetical protein